MQNVLGVILCGGQSKRMGSDKGLLTIGATIWAKFIAEKLLALQIPVVFSINETQRDAYCHYISNNDFVIDSLPLPGPLCGLLSVHKKFPEQDLLLMACDMLDVDAATIKQIIQTCINEPAHDFYVYEDAEFLQPFCGLYTAKGLSIILAKAQSNQLTKFSMQHLLNSANTKKIAIGNKAAFSNYNQKL
jgi:molybdenum cofactor guanylyltransferase